jgi:hypothetical protein
MTQKREPVTVTGSLFFGVQRGEKTGAGRATIFQARALPASSPSVPVV